MMVDTQFGVARLRTESARETVLRCSCRGASRHCSAVADLRRAEEAEAVALRNKHAVAAVLKMADECTVKATHREAIGLREVLFETATYLRTAAERVDYELCAPASTVSEGRAEAKR